MGGITGQTVYVVLCSGWDIDRDYYTYVDSVHATKESAERKCAVMTERERDKKDRDEFSVEEHELEE